MSAYDVSYILLWVVVCVLVVGVAGLYSAFGASQMNRVSSLPAQGPELGEQLTVPHLVDMHEHAVEESSTRWVFVSPDCSFCAAVKRELRGYREALSGTVIVCRGQLAEIEAWTADLPDWPQVVADDDGRVSKLFSVHVSPFYVRLDYDGTCIAKGILSNHRGIGYYEEQTIDHLPATIAT